MYFAGLVSKGNRLKKNSIETNNCNLSCNYTTGRGFVERETLSSSFRAMSRMQSEERKPHSLLSSTKTVQRKFVALPRDNFHIIRSTKLHMSHLKKTSVFSTDQMWVIHSFMAFHYCIDVVAAFYIKLQDSSFLEENRVTN